MGQFHFNDDSIVTVPNVSELVMMVMMNVPATNIQLCSLDLTTLWKMVTENKELTITLTYIYNLLYI